MAGETNTDAVDRVLAETPPPPVDEVKLRADEVVKLRQRAALADQLERDHAHTLSQAAITEATAAIPFVDEIAASHARILLRERIIVKADEHGRLAAFDRETGRHAAVVLKELLSGGEFDRYIRNSHRGGGGGGQTPPDRPAADPHAGGRRLLEMAMNGAAPEGYGGLMGRSNRLRQALARGTRGN